jgi:hypothetical protein
MRYISRSTLLISIALMIAVVAAACDSVADKPTAEPEPPTAVPTIVDSQSLDVSGETTGRTRPDGTNTAAAFSDPEVQECLAGELGIESSEFDIGALRQLDPTNTAAAFEACGAEFGRPGGGGGILGGGGFVGSGIADPEIRECLTGILGEDALDNLGQGSGLGLKPESLAAFEECGLNFGDGGTATFGGGGGLFGGGQRGEGRGGFAGGGLDLECITAELGEDAITLLRNPEGASQADLQQALEACGGVIALTNEVDPVTGSIPIEPAFLPTATSIPVSDLTIEQLTCLSSELEPSDLAAAVVATSAGDLSDISDELLAALQTCGVGS